MKLNRILIVLSGLIWHTFCCSTIQKEFNFYTLKSSDQFYYIQRNCVHIVGLNRANLQNYNASIEFIDISKFTFNDLNTLNQPDLFVNHTNLTSIKFVTYYDPERIELHDNLFSGLVNLTVVTLSGLNIDTIPKNLFSHSPKLTDVDISHNRLSSLDSNTFITNSYLSVLHLAGNQFLQSDQLLDLTLAKNRTRIFLSESFVKDFGSLVTLFRNPNILNIHFDSSNLQSLKLRDFLQFPERDVMLNIRTRDANSVFYIGDPKKQRINAKFVTSDEISKLYTSLRAHIYNTVSMDSDLCRDCRFIKDAFKTYLRDGRFYMYLVDQRIVIEFILECIGLENRFTTEFATNCPTGCLCQYNPFLDKIWINCHNKRLTRIPDIRYPKQFSNISSFAIDLSKNKINTGGLSSIERNVVELVTEINLNGNELRSVNLGDMMMPNLNQIKFCYNPIWSLVDYFTMYVGRTLRILSQAKCSVGVPIPINSLSYMSQKSEAELDWILENVQCNSKN